MNATPTLDPERTDQLRTFLTTEAAADAAVTSPARRPRHLRLAVGVTAAVLLAGSLTVASALTGTGSEPADAVAIEQADGWITVRLIDVDADPQAVVDELRAAGIEARVGDADEVGTSAAGVTGLSAESTDGSVGVGMLSAVPTGAASGDGSAGDAPVGDAEPIEVDGASGVVGTTETVPAGTPTDPSAGEAIELPAAEAEAFDQQLEDAGIRFGDGGEISIRNGADVRVVVYRG